MRYEIIFSDDGISETRKLRVFDQRSIADEIENQLRYEPAVETRNRKCLLGASPSFEHIPPIWELRVGDYRVLYDIDLSENKVTIRAVRQKLSDQLTEEIL